MTDKERDLFRIIRRGQEMGIETFRGVEIDDFEDVLGKLIKYKKPRSRAKANYVGVEIECYSKCSELNLASEIYEAGLENKVHVGRDSSVRFSDDNCRDFEIRVMDTEKRIFKTLISVFQVLKKLEFKVNETCGLHVHIDCRKRDKDIVYDKLLNAQSLLFGLVDKSRLDSRYCRPSSFSTKSDKYRAINYRVGLPTIEVRLHHGTMEVKKICSWISLLLKIVKYRKGSFLIKNPADFKKRIKPNVRLEKYLASEYVARTPGIDYDVAQENDLSAFHPASAQGILNRLVRNS